MAIFRNNFDKKNTRFDECYSILREADFFKWNLFKRINNLQKILTNEEILNYLFFLLNEYISKIKKPTYITIIKISFLLWKLKLTNILNIEERNNLYLFKSQIFYKNRLIKIIPVNYLDSDEKVYAEIKCKEILVIRNKTIIFKFLQPTIYLSNIALVIVYKNFFKINTWINLEKYFWKKNEMILNFEELDLKIVFNDPESSKILIQRLIKNNYLDLSQEISTITKTNENE